MKSRGLVTVALVVGVLVAFGVTGHSQTVDHTMAAQSVSSRPAAAAARQSPAPPRALTASEAVQAVRASGMVARFDRVAVKRMTFAEYMTAAEPGAVANSKYVGPTDDIYVVAFSGLWYPNGRRDGLGAVASGMIKLDANTGYFLGYDYNPRETWPAIFDKLPDRTA